jgi:hypothetical protein
MRRLRPATRLANLRARVAELEQTNCSLRVTAAVAAHAHRGRSGTHRGSLPGAGLLSARQPKKA